MLARRRLLLAAAGALAPRARARDEAAAASAYAPVLPEALVFPRDFGAHPRYRIEWWYLTGLLDRLDGSAPGVGVQVTFFRVRPPIAPENPSAFAAHQLILAHAAIADPRRGTLLHDERIARSGFGLARADEADTHVGVDGWYLQREPVTGSYRARIAAAAFTLELEARPTQALLLQGDRGYSRKQAPGGPAAAAAASHYYSEPQLDLRGAVGTPGESMPAGAAAALPRHGRGWLDHEWSSSLLPAGAGGWDWGGFNLDDGSALTFFRILPDGAGREARGHLFAYAALRARGGPVQVFAPGQVAASARRFWTSPRNGARYPVAQTLVVGQRRFDIDPCMDDQEFDARASSGTVYWEGACRLLEDGQAVGGGYLELTGYAGPAPGMP